MKDVKQYKKQDDNVISAEVVIDAREFSRKHYSFVKYGFTESVTDLQCSGYSLAFPNVMGQLIIVRKTIGDIADGMFTETVPFNSLLKTLRAHHWKMLIVEGTMRDIVDWKYSNACNPETVFECISKWSVLHGIPVMLVDSFDTGQIFAFTCLRQVVLSCQRISAAFSMKDKKLVLPPPLLGISH